MGIKIWNTDISKIKIASWLTPRLPSAYQEVEWIQSSNWVHIDTWFKPNNNSRLVADYQLLDTSGAAPMWCYNNPSNYWMIINTGSWTYMVWLQYWTTYYWNTGVNFDTRKKADLNKNVFSVDDVVVHTFTAQTFQMNINCWIFWWNKNGTQSNGGSLRLWSSQIYDDWTLVRDFVPCYRIADWEIWLYDIENDVFYTNSWSWTFTKWDDVNTPYLDISKVYLGSTQVRPTPSIWYIPQMTANTQDGFTATSSTLLNSWFQPRMAFYESQGSENIAFHSNSVGSWNRAWSEIQMPNSIIVSKLKIWARKNVNDYDLRPISAFNLLGSNDWSNWTNIYSESWLSWTVWEVKEWDITGQNTAYSYLKLEIQATNTYVAFDCWNVAWTVS